MPSDWKRDLAWKGVFSGSRAGRSAPRRVPAGHSRFERSSWQVGAKPTILVLAFLAFGLNCQLWGGSGCPATGYTNGHNRFPVGNVFFSSNPSQQVPITRVFGSGEASDYDSSGVPVDYQGAIQKGLIDRNAKVEFSLRVSLDPKLYAALYTFQAIGVGATLAFLGTPGLGILPSPVVGEFGSYGPIRFSVRLRVNGVPVGKPIYYSIPVTKEGYPLRETQRCLEFDVAQAQLAVARTNASGPPLPGFNSISLDLRNVPSTPFLVVSAALRAVHVDGMAPLVLITGAGEETSGFWKDADLGAQSFERYLQTTKIPYRHLLGWGHLPGPAWPAPGLPAVATVDAPRLVATGILSTAEAFGVKWVNLVGHSKGGLNARYWLTPDGRKSLGASQDSVGALSVTTLNTPHEGSLFANLVRDVTYNSYSARDIGVLASVALRRKVNEEEVSHTFVDLRPNDVNAFNDKYPPAQQSTVREGGKTIVRPIRFSALATDANAITLGDGNDEPAGGPVVRFGRRFIDMAEAVIITPAGMRNTAPSIAASMFEDMYNLMGRATGQWYLTRVTYGIMPTENRLTGLRRDSNKWQLNDFIVTTDSQRPEKYYSKFLALPGITSPAQGPVAGRNHSSVADSVSAEAVFRAVRGLR